MIIIDLTEGEVVVVREFKFLAGGVKMGEKNDELGDMIRAELLKNPEAEPRKMEEMGIDEIESDYDELMGCFNESIWGLESFVLELRENLASCREQMAKMKTELLELQEKNQLLLSQLPAQ